MSQVKEYTLALFGKYKITVAKHHAILLDAYVNDEATVAAYQSILKAQQTMLDLWKQKALVEDVKALHVVLPNGMAGKNYTFTFDFSKEPLSEIGDYELLVPEQTGLTFSKENHTISGTLAEQGEYVLTLQFQIKGSEQPMHSKEIRLIINPDPKSLWKKLNSDTTDPYWKPDAASAHVAFGSHTVVLASKRGRSHEHEGKFRDDGFDAYFNEETGWGVVAVADGAGSAKYSRKGSEIACQTAVDFFKTMDAKLFSAADTLVVSYIAEESEENQKKLSAFFLEHIGKAAFQAQGKIREEATANGADMRDYSTTLIFSFVKQFNSRFVTASFWVGDGGIGLYHQPKNEVAVLGTPDSGEFAGQTRFLTMSDIFADNAYVSRIRYKIVEDFTALVLMTDGITDPKFQTDANLNRVEKWNELWADLGGKNNDGCVVDFSASPELVEEQLMAWLDFWSPGNHDDRTIAILY